MKCYLEGLILYILGWVMRYELKLWCFWGVKNFDMVIYFYMIVIVYIFCGFIFYMKGNMIILSLSFLKVEYYW